MPKLPKPRKERTIYIKSELHQWTEEQIRKGRFGNFSHAVEIALEKLRDAETQAKQSNSRHQTVNKEKHHPPS